MRQLTLRVEDAGLTINGERFTLRMTDVELFTRAQAVLDRCAALADEPVTPARVLDAARLVTGLIDEALGEGATMRVSEGRPVSLPLAVEWLAALAQEAAEHCADSLLREDGALPSADGAGEAQACG